MTTSESHDVTALQDKHLKNLAKSLNRFSTVAEKNEGVYALFSIGVKVADENQIETMTTVIGDRNVLFKGLYAELSNLLEAGEDQLFIILTEVLYALHRDRQDTPIGTETKPN